MPTIAANDSRLTWSGVISLKEGPGWVKPWRIPHGDLDLYSPGESGLAGRAEMPSACACAWLRMPRNWSSAASR